MSAAGLRAVSASRWRFEHEGRGRWWYKVTVEGARGACYEVELVHSDGARPLPFKVERCGRTSRRLGYSGGELKAMIEDTACAALEV